MKTKKKYILLSTIILALLVLGGGAWALFHPSKPQAEVVKQPSKLRTPTAPSITLNIPQSSLDQAAATGSLEVSITTDSYRSIMRVEYFIDGVLITYSTTQPFSVTIDLSTLTPGTHTLQAVAYSKNGKTSKSPPFTFILTDSDEVQPADDSSTSIVRRSSSSTTLANQSNSGGNSNSGGGSQEPGDSTPWPDEPPALICGNSNILNGPSSPPVGAVVVPAGDNSGFDFTSADTTYWFAPGTHTIGNGQFNQISPRNNTTFVGAPGAIIDGQNINENAFTGTATNVKIQYLTITKFVTNRDQGTINHDSGSNWTIEYITAHNNRGGAVFAGTNNVVRYNCIKDNGQYGFQVFSAAGPSNVTLDHNEIAHNNTDNWEDVIDGCGCTGGGKFWDAHGVDVTNNYIHDNLSVGLWADTNDTDFLIEGNYISNNESQGLFYEISYNMIVRKNNFVRNGIVAGPGNPSFPTGAIYLSEAGGDSRISGRTDKIDIYDNQFTDNWAGIVLWENADRFCASPSNTSTGYCTIVNPAATLTTCGDPGAGGSVNVQPYLSDCRWKTQNVKVHNNVFSLDRSAIANCTVNNSCGFQGIFSNTGTSPLWSPYMGTVIQQAITFNQNNLFSNNTYLGDWRYKAKSENSITNFALWQSLYGQDTGSTYNGQSTQIIPNYLDNDTSTLEGSIGQWTNWFSATVSRTAAVQAHGGTQSLRVDITAPFGWGVQTSNPTGPQVTLTPKRASFWAKRGSGSNLRVRMDIRWLNASQTLLRTDSITSPILTDDWQEASGTFTPPSNTVTASIVIVDSSGDNGDSLYLDDIVLGDNI